MNWDHLKSRRPSDTERDALQSELVERAIAVKQHGWDDYRDAWTAGDAAGVAYLLGDTEALEQFEEHEGSILTRYAGALYGFNGARKEIAAGLPDTQAWFAAARAKVQRAAR
ncbi:hypothetical protein [Nocardia yamanashiensis]|uniref:hypothetical protein n=1 Tax=Nocardia yamanashiensis TaxID=209247 RepID=UPI000830847D|nr:hypothetical protein [Nocardia yamanashiensis]